MAASATPMNRALAQRSLTPRPRRDWTSRLAQAASRKGHDVRREEFKRSLNEAMRPLTGMSHEQTKAFERRMKLPAGVQAECKLLDIRLPDQEQTVRTSAQAARADAEVQLFLSRRQFRELGC